jgi:hypothetical protein
LAWKIHHRAATPMSVQEHLTTAADIRQVAATIGELSTRSELLKIAIRFERLAARGIGRVADCDSPPN